MSLDAVAAAGQIVGLPGLLDTCRAEAFDVDFVSWGFYTPQPWRNYWHRHSFFEVCLVYAGAGRFSHGSDTVTVGPGEVFLARPGVVHEIESSRSDPLGIAFWGFGLTARRGGPRVRSAGWWTGLYAGSLVSRRLGSLPAVLAALAAEASQPRSGHVGLCKALGATLVIETGRAFAEPAALAADPVRLDRSEQMLATMHRYLLDNLARPITVRDVAAAVHLSERHANRLFVEQAGAPMMTALRRLRLEHAARLLLDTDRQVADVAVDSGYADLAAFRAAFRTLHGQTPQAFRASRGTLHLPRRSDAAKVDPGAAHGPAAHGLR